MKMSVVLYTLLARFLLVIIFTLLAIPIVIISCIPEKVRWSSPAVFYCINLFYWSILKCSFLSITYTGQENLPNQPAIFVANHQSSLDIPLLGVLARGYPHIWLARSELTESLLLRYVLPIFTVVADVTSTRAAMVSLRRILSLLIDHNRHLMIFPEGSRFDDGAIHPFFNGFTTIAKKTGRPIIPVYIRGINKVYPRGSFLIHWYPVQVIIGPPLVLQEGEPHELFKERVHEWFVNQASAF